MPPRAPKQGTVPRERLAAVTVGGRAHFAGGFGPAGWSDVVDVYDSATGAWSALHLPSALEVRLMVVAAKIVGAAAESKALFTGGWTVHVLDTTTLTWTSTSLAAPWVVGDTVVAASVEQKALFAGGRVPASPSGTVTDIVEIYEELIGVARSLWGNSMQGASLLGKGRLRRARVLLASGLEPRPSGLHCQPTPGLPTFWEGAQHPCGLTRTPRARPR